jgi:hypothetical protein
MRKRNYNTAVSRLLELLKSQAYSQRHRRLLDLDHSVTSSKKLTEKGLDDWMARLLKMCNQRRPMRRRPEMSS